MTYLKVEVFTNNNRHWIKPNEEFVSTMCAYKSTHAHCNQNYPKLRFCKPKKTLIVERLVCLTFPFDPQILPIELVERFAPCRVQTGMTRTQ